MRKVDGWWVPDRAEWSADIRARKAEQIEFVLQHAPRRACAVNAGAWNGLFPAELSRHFEHVVAFEPEPENYACAFRNCANVSGHIEIYHAALAEFSGMVPLIGADDGLNWLATDPDAMALQPFGANPSAFQNVRAMTLDELALGACDLILLDVEGYEHRVLEGAEQTIARHGPTVMFEENALLSRYDRARGDVGRWLEARGYEYRGAWTTLPPELQNDGHFRGADLIYAPRLS